jgi:hypothetical protein
MKTIEIKLFQFDELSDESKQRAIQEWREEGIDHWWTDEYIETIKKGLKAFDAVFADYEIDFAETYRSSWRIDALEPKEEITGQRLRTWIINNYWGVLYSKKHYGEYTKDATGTWKYPRYSRIIQTESDCPFTGFCGDNDFLEPMRKFIKRPNDGQTFKDLLNECVESVLFAGNKDFEYQYSDEGIAETIRGNEYDFRANGERY